MREVISTYPLTEKVRSFIDTSNEIPFVKTVGIGDLSVLPPPQKLESWTPAVLVCPETVSLSCPANKKFATGEYSFVIRYIKYYNTSDYINVQAEAIKEADILANILM